MIFLLVRYILDCQKFMSPKMIKENVTYTTYQSAKKPITLWRPGFQDITTSLRPQDFLQYIEDSRLC